MKGKKLKDLKKVEKREKTFSTLAKEEGKGAASRARKEKAEHLPQSAKDSRWETKVDNMFANVRRRKAGRYQDEINKLKK